MDEDSDSPGVYFLVNPITTEVYIGSSGKVLERKSQHESLLKNNRHPNKRLQRSYNQNGSMVFVALTLPNRDTALDHEQALLDGSLGEMGVLNISRNARYCRVDGLKHTEETKAKIGAASRGNTYALGTKHSAETRAKVSAALTGRPVSEETRRKMSATHTGKTMPRDGVEKMRQSKIGAKQSPETIERRAAALRGRVRTTDQIQMYRNAKALVARKVSIDGVVYDSINEAGRILGLNPGTIHNRVNSDNFPTWFYQ